MVARDGGTEMEHGRKGTEKMLVGTFPSLISSSSIRLPLAPSLVTPYHATCVPSILYPLPTTASIGNLELAGKEVGKGGRVS